MRLLIWELIFIYCGLLVLILVVFCVVSSFTTFRPNFMFPFFFFFFFSYLKKNYMKDFRESYLSYLILFFFFFFFFRLHFFSKLIVSKKKKLLTVVKGDQNAPFSIATTPRCRGGHYSFLWIAPLYPWYVPYIAKC